MKLSALTLPIPYEQARSLCLVFGDQMGARLAELHALHGSPNCVPVPRRLVDGRLMLSADVLTEVTPGRLLAAMWDAADQSLLSQGVEVFAREEVLPLLVPDPRPE